MIEKCPTVFVLGAGASKPYGFPSGQELVHCVYELLGRFDFRDYVERGGIHGRTVKAFQANLLASNIASIDRFLEINQEWLKLGKVAIATVLLEHENANPDLEPEDAAQCWYRYLYHRLSEHPGGVGANKVSFVTYNYDRSLEAFLFRSVRATYPDRGEEFAYKVLEEIPIEHVHGSMSDFLNGEYGIAPAPKEALYLQAWTQAQNLRIVSEEVAYMINVAHNLIDSAERVVFLGFGFHPTNVARLMKGPAMRKGEKSILGTAFNLWDAERVPIAEAVPGIRLGERDEDCVRFLRNHVVFR